MKLMKKLYFAFLSAIILAGCNSSEKFEVNGIITNANNQMLYLEHIGLQQVTTLDSVVLNFEGKFRFKSKSPDYPDLYRLRTGLKNIDFVVDSTETITFTTDAATPADVYEVSGSSAGEQLRRLRSSVIAIQRKINVLAADSLDREAKIAEIQKDIERHKENARRIILENPRSMVSYFALYQTVSDSYIFTPYSSEDKPYFAAVATAFDTYMHDYVRSKNLRAFVLDAINAERRTKSEEKWKTMIDASEVGYIDIALNDRNNRLRKLSELEGKVILLDFSAFATENSVQYVFELRELYNRYHDKGFEIYQVSLDNNKLFWQQQSENLPWICVRDDAGNRSNYINLYNIQSIPVMFLINKQGEIITRENDFKKINSLISKNLQ